MIKFLKITGLIFLFIALINLSIKVFNLYDAWIGIGLGIFTIISYICLIIYSIKKYKFK